MNFHNKKTKKNNINGNYRTIDNFHDGTAGY
jgi:hypothetical protein